MLMSNPCRPWTTGSQGTSERLGTYPIAFAVVSGQHDAVSTPPLDTLNDRVWYAWHCLPRGANGRPPPWKPFEKLHGIALATFQKLATEDRRSVDFETLVKLARALGVTTDWLSKGEGPAPTPTGPVSSRAERYALAQTLDATMAKVEAGGGVGPATEPTTQLQMAVATLLEEISPETIAKVTAEHKGAEDTKPAHHWGRILRDEEKVQRGRRMVEGAGQPQPRAKRSVKRRAKAHSEAPASVPVPVPAKRRAS